MASFTREDYDRVFQFALTVWTSQRGKRPARALETEAIAIMDMVEDCTGQRSERPVGSRHD